MVISKTNSIFYPITCLYVRPQGKVENEMGVVASLEISTPLAVSSAPELVSRSLFS